MNKNKTLILINIVLLFSCVVCIVFLINKRQKDDQVKRIAIELLDGMIKETQDGFAEHFKYYEMSKFIIREKIDSFYVLKNQKKSFYSPQLMEYYNKLVSINSGETEKVFNTLRLIRDDQSEDFLLLAKFVEYRFLKKIIEESGYLSFFWLDSFGVNVCSKKDTIQMGEEYIATFSYSGEILNKLQQPIVVLDGDTLNADQGYCLFKEKPKTKGLMKHKGYMTYFHPLVGIGELDLEFEYYVK
jgi:hypothetical protein